MIASAIWARIRLVYDRTINSLAFWPAIITLAYILLGLLSMQEIEYWAFQSVQQELSKLAIVQPATARTVLSVLAGGMISLVVFSFSMVMVVLNQASSQYSPRLLPKLISNQRHQIILGCYLGSIAFSLLVLIQVRPATAQGFAVPPLAILLSLIFGLLNLGLFVTFIHSISNAVRIDRILFRTYQDTSKAIKRHLVDASLPDEYKPKSIQWHAFSLERTGYLLSIDYEGLAAAAHSKDVLLEIRVTEGLFIHRGDDCIRINQKPTEEDKPIDWVSSYFDFSFEENITKNYSSGLHRLTEIALRAMSPGINDPKTAIIALDYLGELLYELVDKQPPRFIRDEEDNIRLYLNPVPFDRLVFELLAPMRTYFSKDVIVMERVIKMLRHMLQLKELSSERAEIINDELSKIKAQINSEIVNESDRQLLTELINS